MRKNNSLNSELFLSNWTTEALDSSVKHWMECKSKQSSTCTYVISDKESKFMKIDFANPIKQAEVLKIDSVPLASATVFENIQSANAVISFLGAAGIQNLNELQIRNLQGLLHCSRNVKCG